MGVKNTQKRQLFTALETDEGTPVIDPTVAPPNSTGLTAENAVQALEMAPIDVDQEMEDVDEASASLSPGDMAPGRETPDLAFTQYLRGSGDSTYAREPDIGKHLRMAGLQEFKPTLCVGAITGTFQPGEEVEQSTSGAKGICLFAGDFGVGAGDDELWVYPTNAITFDNTNDINGAITSATLTPNTGGVQSGHGYRPASAPQLRIEHQDNLSGTFQLGETIVGATSGASATIVSIVEGPGTTMVVEPCLKAFAVNEVVTGQNSGATITLHATDLNATWLAMAPGTLYQNVDGIAAAITGGRMNFELPLQAGNVMRARFSARGSVIEHGDRAMTTGLASVGQDTSGKLQFASAFLVVTEDKTAVTKFHRIPLASLTLNLGNALEYNEDPNGAGGVGGANIYGREPSLTIDPNAVPHGVIDWRQWRRNSTKFLLIVSVGTTKGNRVAILLPTCQVTAVADADDGGRWRKNITAVPTKQSQDGDNELYLFFA